MTIDLPAGYTLPMNEELNAIAKESITYAQETLDPNDVAFAIHVAVAKTDELITQKAVDGIGLAIKHHLPKDKSPEEAAVANQMSFVTNVRSYVRALQHTVEQGRASKEDVTILDGLHLLLSRIQ